MKSIIMVDDDTEILNVFKLVFERAGYTITLFNKSDDLLNNRFQEPDIFIIDKQLSGASGLDLCRFLKNRQPRRDTPIILFSASTNLDIQAAEAGADEYLEKPFRTKTLLQLVEKHLSKTAA